MSDLTDFLLNIFPRPQDLAIFTFDHAAEVYARATKESPLNIDNLLAWLERDSTLADLFWQKFGQVYPRQVLAWPVAPTKGFLSCKSCKSC